MSAPTSPRVGILGVGSYVPERVMTNAEWADHVDTTPEWILSRTGIERRRFAAEGENTSDLAVAAALPALAEAGITARDLDEIIVATDTPELYTPDTSCLVQHRLGARNIPTYDLGGSGCAGFLQALDVARSRVLAGQRKILVVGVELLSRLMDWTERETCVLFGDAAGAVVVGEVEGPGEILGALAGTDGSRAEILTMEVGGTRKPFSAERALAGENGIVMNGREVFREAVRRMSQASQELLGRLGVSLDEVALLIPHQANLRIIHSLAKGLSLPLDRVFVNVQDYGNTGSASVPLALAEARAQRRISPGDLVLLTSFGAGFHWAAVLVRF